MRQIAAGARPRSNRHARAPIWRNRFGDWQGIAKAACRLCNDCRSQSANHSGTVIAPACRTHYRRDVMSTHRLSARIVKASAWMLALALSATALAWPPLGYEGQQGTSVSGTYFAEEAGFQAYRVNLAGMHIDHGKLMGTMPSSFTALIDNSTAGFSRAVTLEVVRAAP